MSFHKYLRHKDFGKSLDHMYLRVDVVHGQGSPTYTADGAPRAYKDGARVIDRIIVPEFRVEGKQGRGEVRLFPFACPVHGL
jgi:hypothetical protein